MRVLLIGAGRYGNNLVGRKYRNGELGVKLAGVIDPKIDEIKQSASYCMDGIPTYHSLDEVPYELTKNTVADVALIPQIVPQIFGNIANKGIKKVILPKPVTTNFEEYKELCSIVDENNIQALVASNWHYSDITNRLRSLVKEVAYNGSGTSTDKKICQELRDTDFDVNSIAVEYSKKDETLAIDPPLQELPHALQILYSTGLVKDLKSIRTVMDKKLQSESRVNLKMQNVDGVREGITVNSDLKSGNKLKSNRERKVEILLDEDINKGKITADYDAVFDADGTCKKYPEIVYEYNDGPTPQKISYVIKEDNINKMYEEMFKTMNDESNRSLTIDDYKPLAEYLSDVEAKWLNR